MSDGYCYTPYEDKLHTEREREAAIERANVIIKTLLKELKIKEEEIRKLLKESIEQ